MSTTLRLFCAMILGWSSASSALAGLQFGVVINEINYAPNAAFAVSDPRRYEYVELYNRGATPISISGWTLRDLDAANADQTLYVFPALTFPPSAFLVVVTSGAIGNLEEDSDLNDGSGLLISSAWTGSATLANAGDAVQVYDAPGTTLQDFVYYDEANIGDSAVDDDAVAEGIWKDGAAIDTLSSGTTGRAIALRIDGATPNEVSPLLNAEDLDWAQYSAATGGTPGAANQLGVLGDYNNNGTADAADYIVWRDNVGTANQLPNDATGGTIGTTQYNTWRSHFGQTVGSGTQFAAVPEPITGWLVLAAVSTQLVRRFRHLPCFEIKRLGYFFTDPVDSKPGKPVFNRTATLRDTWAKEAAKE